MPSFAAQTAVASEPAPHQIFRAGPARMGLEAQQARRIGEHRPRIRLGETLAAAAGRGTPRAWRRPMSASLSPSCRAVAEIAPAVDHLLGRAAADAELQPAAGDQVGRAGVLDHIERVLVAHVDDRGADLDAAASSRRPPPGAETARRAGERNDGRGSRRRPRRVPRRRRRGRSTAAARPPPMRAWDCADGVQWPNDRKPIFFMGATLPGFPARDDGSRDRGRRGVRCGQGPR